MNVDGQIVTAMLHSATARDFSALLPLSLTLTDYAAIERILICRKSSTVGAPAGMTPEAGDLTYYALGAIWRFSSAAGPMRKGCSRSAGWVRIWLPCSAPVH
jgi:hypothetical protein